MHLSVSQSTVVHMHPQPTNRSGAYALAKMTPVPNQPKTGNRVIRVPTELWDEFGQLCEAEGTDRAKDLRAYMQRRVRRWKRLQAKAKPDPKP